MMRWTKGLEWIGFALLVGAAMMACDDREADQSEDATVFRMDTGTADTGVDTGTDTVEEIDTGVDVIRQVVDRGLFGEMPAKNYVLDPLFRGRSSWIPLVVRGGRPTDYAEAYREAHPQTPMSAPVLRVSEVDDSAQTRLLGGVVLRQQPLEVSIWIGRPDEPDDSAQVEVLGVTSEDPSQTNTVEVPADTESARKVGGIYWMKYATTLTGFFGRGYLQVQASLEKPLYLHAPVVAETDGMPGALKRFDTPEVRAANALDRKSIELARQWERRHRPDPLDIMFGPTRDLVVPSFDQ